VLDTLYIDDVQQADALLKPKRVEILRHLAEPTTCTQIGGALGETPQAIYYHVKRLQAAGLVSLVDERRVRGIAEGIQLSPEDGAAFVAELQRAFGEVLTKYAGGEGHTFRLALACYPQQS
jgi:DNA-binding transcriptional ArsR family regulator